MRRILIIEDDRDLSDIARMHLVNAGYLSDQAFSLTEALSSLEENTYSLILLDVLLPDSEGFSLCKTIRERCRCPIIFMSCLDDSESVLSAFDAGADDYVVKPIKYAELLARIDTHIRRAMAYDDNETPSFNENLIRLKRFTLDRQHRRVMAGGAEISLSAIEYALLNYFVTHRDRLLLYEELYNHVWGADCLGDVRTVLVHISNLRKKIDPEHVGLIETVRGAGYIFSDI